MWSVETGGNPISLPPVVSENTVMVVPKGLALMAFDTGSGAKLWEYDPGKTVWHRSLGSDSTRAYICSKGGKIAALDVTNGKQLWQKDLGIECQRPPHIAGGNMYVSTTFIGPGINGEIINGAKLFSINPENGNINWAFKSKNYLLQTAFRKGNTVYVGGSYLDPKIDVDEGGPIRFYALDNANGTPKWEYISEDGLPKALYATDKRLIYIGYRDYLVGLDATDGKKIWRKTTGNWVPSLNGLDDVVFYGAANTKVHAWDTLTGKSRWMFNIPGGSFNYLMGKPLFKGDRMYFMSQKGTVFALNLDNGKEIWSQATGMNPRVGLSVGKNMLFMGDAKGTVYAYDILK